ncbi:MAG: hypothetical protein RLY47_142 [Candidatus Parcubacteria bacterium]|jgi:hypothetical protein
MEIFWIWAISICIGGAVWIATFLFGPAILERRPDIGALIVGILSAVGFGLIQLYVFSTRWPFIVLGIITVIVDVLFILAICSGGGEEDDDYHYR